MRDIIFIAGRGRSGSTLLGKTFDTSHDVFHIGELRYFVQIGWKENRECECGERLRCCPFWSKIIHLWEKYDIDKIQTASKGLPTHLEIALRNKVNKSIEYNSVYLSFLNKLYHIVGDLSESRYIFDSSKFPIYLYYLINLKDVRVKVIHLTRDPRGTSHSWSTKKQGSKGQSSELVGQHSFLKEATKWRLWNGLIRDMLKDVEYSVHTKWEDFLSDPCGESERIIRALNLDMSRPAFVSPSHIRLSIGHAFWGNSSRRLNGLTEIRREEKWRQHMLVWKKSLIYALAGASRFGYEK